MPSNSDITKKEWFDEWFNTIYYHILYKHRDYEDAAAFLNRLIDLFKIPTEAKILDVACGKGRHAIFLSEKGFDVTGFDLSERNIELAQKYTNEKLHFAVHDMRNVYEPENFDYIFNLFTSFGYFDSKEENLEAINAIVASLKPKGKFLLDFLNPYVVINNLVRTEEKEIENIHFQIERKYTLDEFIIKDIKVTDHGQQYQFQEKVKAIRRTDFLKHFETMGLKVVDIFGDYDLHNYVSDQSPRLIFVVEK